MIWLASVFKNKNDYQIWTFPFMRKRWSINIFSGKLDLSLANMFKICRLTAIKWTVKRECCKTAQWVVFQRGCWCTKSTSQSSGYLQPCGQIYHIICAESRGLHPCRPNLWTSGSLPPFSDRPIVGVLENHQLTDLLVWALAELRRGYNLIELRSKMAHLLFGGSIIYCTGISVNAAVNVLLLLKEIWIGQLLWADSLQHSDLNDSVWWYMTKTDWTAVFKTSWELDFLSCPNHDVSLKTILFYISVFFDFQTLHFTHWLGMQD